MSVSRALEKQLAGSTKNHCTLTSPGSSPPPIFSLSTHEPFRQKLYKGPATEQSSLSQLKGPPQCRKMVCNLLVLPLANYIPDLQELPSWSPTLLPVDDSHSKHRLQSASVVSLTFVEKCKDTNYHFNKRSLHIFHPLNSEFKSKKASVTSTSTSETDHKAQCENCLKT